jgi:phenylpropionate dioxygenase-like ring-hydroxylating dioxygenase large terminal subunit
MSMPSNLLQDNHPVAPDDSWHCVGREEQLERSGSYLPCTINGERLLIVRAGDGSCEAVHAVGMHKGQLIEFHAHDECRSLRCPLHEWTVDLNGNLHHVAHAEDDGSIKIWSTLAARRPLEITIRQGLVFVR